MLLKIKGLYIKTIKINHIKYSVYIYKYSIVSIKSVKMTFHIVPNGVQCVPQSKSVVVLLLLLYSFCSVTFDIAFALGTQCCLLFISCHMEGVEWQGR